MKKGFISKYFLFICIASITTLLISNITSSKLFAVGNLILPASALLFPITYIVGDIIAEVYGFNNARFVILLGFLCNAFMVLFFYVAIKLPPSNTYLNQEAFYTVLSTTPRMFFASISAFLVGSLSNAYVMDLVKKITKGKYLAVRTISSTIVGELLDTLIFVIIGFLNVIPTSALITTIVCQFVWKVGYEILATPFTYIVINFYKKLEE